MADTAVIGIDWGTSSLRAFRLDGSGAVRERREAPLGILAVTDGDFAGTLAGQIGDWAEAAPRAPIVMSGMIGSRQGWAEAPYRPCPAAAKDIAAGMIAVPWRDGRRVWIAPGLSRRVEAGAPDVMRGEETQIIGAAGELGPGTHRVCLPGTHSKWATVADGRIIGFATHMTGEAFDVLRRHSILGRLIPNESPLNGPVHDRWFRAGVVRAADGGGLLNHLFGNRAAGLMGDIPGEGIRAHLSGLLIGHEVAAAARDGRTVSLLGAPELCRLYEMALGARGVTTRRLDSDAVATGLAMLARRLPDPA